MLKDKVIPKIYMQIAALIAMAVLCLGVILCAISLSEISGNTVRYSWEIAEIGNRLGDINDTLRYKR